MFPFLFRRVSIVVKVRLLRAAWHRGRGPANFQVGAEPQARMRTPISSSAIISLHHHANQSDRIIGNGDSMDDRQVESWPR